MHFSIRHVKRKLYNAVVGVSVLIIALSMPNILLRERERESKSLKQTSVIMQ